MNFILTIFLLLISSICSPSFSQENTQQSEPKNKVLKEEIVPTHTIKSTADLNLKTIINENQTSYQSQNKKITRFKVDRIMFNFLLEGLNQTLITDNNNINITKEKLRKNNPWLERKALLEEMKLLKKKKKSVEGEIASVTKKIKKINTTISKGNLKNDEDFMFDGNINNSNNSLAISENLIYKVQIGVYTNKISKEIFKGLSPVFEDLFDGGVKYSVGAFKKLLYAQQAKKYVVDLGLEDAFIIAYLNGERISISKAIEIEE